MFKQSPFTDIPGTAGKYRICKISKLKIYNAFDTLQIRYITNFRYFTVSIFPRGADIP